MSEQEKEVKRQAMIITIVALEMAAWRLEQLIAEDEDEKREKFLEKAYASNK